MAIRIIKDGITFEVETGDELQVVLSALKDRQGKIVESKSTDIKPKNLTEFFKSIDKDSNQRKFIVALRDKPTGMTDDELRSLLKLDTGPALGGTLGALTKLANKAGLHSEDIYRTEPRQDGWYYQLTDEMMEAIKDMN